LGNGLEVNKCLGVSVLLAYGYFSAVIEAGSGEARLMSRKCRALSSFRDAMA